MDSAFTKNGQDTHNTPAIDRLFFNLTQIRRNAKENPTKKGFRRNAENPICGAEGALVELCAVGDHLLMVVVLQVARGDRCLSAAI